jgi:hypothetical protein
MGIDRPRARPPRDWGLRGKLLLLQEADIELLY